MYLSSLHLYHYRNYRQLDCDFCPGINLINGANAQGKTNLVEAIHYLSIGKAYRPARDEQLALWGERSFSIRGEIKKRQGQTEIGIDYKVDEKPAKTILSDGFRRTKWEEVSGALTSVLFSPESMAIIKGSPLGRRSLLNDDISQISLTYSANIYKYNRLLAQRNALLKNLKNVNLQFDEKVEKLSIWDQQLIHYGRIIIERRLSFVEKLSPLIRLIHRKLADNKENMELHYLHYSRNVTIDRKEKDIKKDIESFLREERDTTLEEDLRLGTTQWGPHRDDIKITIDGVDARQYGSQGQQRTAILAIKLAELEIFRGETGEYPILLLDDVMSELDENRQNKLLNFINEKYIQCVITATEAKKIHLIEKRQFKRFLVDMGEIQEV